MNKTLVRARNGKPTVYLIDEYHRCDRCTDESIDAARQLFRDGVEIAGVEGYEGGRCYDDYKNAYVEKRVPAGIGEEARIGDYPRFASALDSAGHLVVGVDCRGLSNMIETDLYDGTWEGTIADHPNQRRRSEHFVRTLNEEAQSRSLAGDLLLNAGAAHNDHIVELLQTDSLPDGWPDYQYVRIRCASFEECRTISAAPAP